MNIDFGNDGESLLTATSLADNANTGTDYGYIGLIVGISLGSIIFSIILLVCCFKFSRQNQPNVSNQEILSPEMELAHKIPKRDDSLATHNKSFDGDNDSMSDHTLHSVILK